jgi:hypothetical protein
VIVLFAEVYVKSSTPATDVVLAEVILPSGAIAITGISVDEPYVFAVTPEFDMSVVISMIPAFDVADPVTSPLKFTVVVDADP